MSEEVRELTPLELCRRVKALDAMYLNADRRLGELQQDRTLGALRRYRQARRAYEQMRDTPYRVAGEAEHG